MAWGALLQGLLPLIVFVLVDLFAGIKWGVIAAIAFAVIEVAATWGMTHEVDSTTIISALLVILLGVITLRMDDARFFKFQPVVLGVVMAGFLAWYQLFDTPLLLKYMDRNSVLVPQQMRDMMQTPIMRTMLGNLSGDLIWFFLLHAALVAWAALRLSTVWWLVMRGVGFYVLLFVLYAVEFVRVYR